MIVAKRTIVELQTFLMLAATELGRVRGESDELGKAVFAGSSGLDYALLLASENGYGVIDDDSDVARAMRSTMTKAVETALDALACMLDARDGTYDAFLEQRVDVRAVAASMRELCDRGIVAGDDLAFRALAVASDVIDRR